MRAVQAGPHVEAASANYLLQKRVRGALQQSMLMSERKYGQAYYCAEGTSVFEKVAVTIKAALACLILTHKKSNPFSPILNYLYKLLFQVFQGTDLDT